jgi:Na+/proline symporter
LAKQDQIRDMLAAIEAGSDSEIKIAAQRVKDSQRSELDIKEEAIKLIRNADPDADTNDTDYIFLNFVIAYLPAGLIGLILAAILSASMSSTSAELNALAAITVIDIYKRIFKKNGSDRQYLFVSKLATVFWGLYAITFALFANYLGSLVEAVNILGSLFYGTILGIFLVGFFFKKIGGNATFIAAIFTELTVLACYFFTSIPYLWFNVIGPVVLVVIACVINPFFSDKKTSLA